MKVLLSISLCTALLLSAARFQKQTSRGERDDVSLDQIQTAIRIGIGVVAGLINWYLMDPGFFGR